MKKKQVAKWLSHPVSTEMRELKLRDRRLNSRIERTIDALSVSPGKGFPTSIGAHCDLEALYRIFRNKRVSSEDLIEGHLQNSCERVESQQLAFILHDTTEFEFSGDSARAGLGWLTKSKKFNQGFFGHFAVAVSQGENPIPLGLVAVKTFTRNKPPVGKKKSHLRTNAHDRESLRWGEIAQEVQDRITSNNIIHVMDREADIYELLAQLKKSKQRFIIRMKADRSLATAEVAKAFKVIESAQPMTEREVSICSRKKAWSNEPYRQGRGRKARIARLAFSATSLEVPRPKQLGSREEMQSLQLNIVRAFEIDAPSGCEPVEWKLITSEPIQTPEQILFVVDGYRKRWVIEEFFKALKTGCAFEKRQLESFEALKKALALFVPIAWRLLLLRNVARMMPDLPAQIALTDSEMTVLRYFSSTHLPDNPTLRDVSYAIAALAGHIKNNGDPGWFVLGQGLQRLHDYHMVWTAAQNEKKDVINH